MGSHAVICITTKTWPHGFERAAAALQLSTKDFPTLLGNRCPSDLHLVGSFPLSPPNTATPRLWRTSRHLLVFVCTKMSKNYFLRGEARQYPLCCVFNPLRWCGQVGREPTGIHYHFGLMTSPFLPSAMNWVFILWNKYVHHHYRAYQGYYRHSKSQAEVLYLLLAPVTEHRYS